MTLSNVFIMYYLFSGVLPVPERGLRLARKDTATEPVLVTFTVCLRTLLGVT